MFPVIQILDDDTLLIHKGLLRLLKRHAMVGHVCLILVVVPLEIRRFHDSNVIQTNSRCKKKKGPFRTCISLRRMDLTAAEFHLQLLDDTSDEIVKSPADALGHLFHSR